MYHVGENILMKLTIRCARIASMSKTQTTARQAFAADIIEELKKVSWPTRKETIRLTTVVIAITLIIGAYIGIIDVLLAKALEMITKIR